MPSVDVGLAIIERGGRWLVTRRRAGQHLAGYWEFPGGKRHRGEAWRACVAREVHEELGLLVNVGEPMARIRHRYPNRTVHLRVFRCTIQPGIGECGPRPECHWVTARGLIRLQMPPANTPLVKRLLSSLLPRRGFQLTTSPSHARIRSARSSRTARLRKPRGFSLKKVRDYAEGRDD